MAVIFKASSDSGSFTRSSRIIAPLVRFFYPGISDQALHSVVFGVRKVAHVIEYAILVTLLWRAIRRDGWLQPEFDWKASVWVVVLAGVYAASDEFHQYFVPSRGASVIDVVIDITGGIAGLFLVLLAGQCFRRQKAPKI